MKELLYTVLTELSAFRFWEMLAYLANTLIFVIVGVLVAQYIHLFTGADVFYLFILYIGIIVIRQVQTISLQCITSRLIGRLVPSPMVR